MSEKNYKTYMLDTPENEHQAQVALRLLEDERRVTDDTGMTNADKWDRVVAVFKAEKATLFSKIDLMEIYSDDEHRTAEAAAHICDLRAQFFEIMLMEQPTNPLYHELYVQNRQWQVRLRERARLHGFAEAARKVYKAN